MWWEILPSAGIVFGALFIPHIANYGMNHLFLNGKHCVRDWRDGKYFDDYKCYQRDHRITGSEYIPRSLESVPDLKGVPAPRYSSEKIAEVKTDPQCE